MVMSIEEFRSVIKDAVENLIPEYCFQEVDVTKPNDIKRVGLNFGKEEDRCRCVLYLNSEYEKYSEGKLAVSDAILDIAENIKSLSRSGQDEKGEILDMLDNLKSMKDSIVFKVVNYEWNTEFLKDKPYMRYGNLAIVFYFLLDIKQDCMSTIVITTEHARAMDLHICDLFCLAKENMSKLLPVKFSSMLSVLSGLMGNTPDEVRDLFEATKDIEDEDDMYVLTNTYGMHGASVMFYEGVLKAIAYKLHTEKIIILPSSIHEVLVMKCKEEYDRESINSMIVEINGSQVEPQDRLADTAYVYDVTTDKITIL